MSSRTQHRLLYLLLLSGTILTGLVVHLVPLPLGRDLRDVLGDALWASMIVWWTGLLAPAMPLARRLAIALAVCAAVELSQLVRTPWLAALRGTTLGHLVLGSDFDPRDLAAYAGGVVAACMIDALIRRRRDPSPRPPVS